jgi:hypothetical protein
MCGLVVYGLLPPTMHRFLSYRTLSDPRQQMQALSFANGDGSMGNVINFRRCGDAKVAEYARQINHLDEKLTKIVLRALKIVRLIDDSALEKFIGRLICKLAGILWREYGHGCALSALVMASVVLDSMEQPAGGTERLTSDNESPH